MKIPECKSKHGHLWAGGWMGGDDYQRCSWCGHIAHYSKIKKDRHGNDKARILEADGTSSLRVDGPEGNEEKDHHDSLSSKKEIMKEHFENPYYLKNRGTYSEVTNKSIKEIFEARMMKLGFRNFTKDGIKNTYTVDEVQSRWEEFYNGFRLGEDAR